MVKGKAWTDEEHDLLRREYKRLSYAQIGGLLGRTTTAVKARAGVIGITRSRLWNAADIEQLFAEYPDTDTAKLAARLGRPAHSVYGKAKKLGLAKSTEYLTKLRKADGERLKILGAGTRFDNGHKSWNKGTKGISGTHPNCKATQFRKGQKAINHRPVGSERVNVDGYIEVKVAEPNRWDLKQRVVWREYHGSIPSRHLISFIDRNPLNCVIENLECVSREAWMKRHTFHNYPEPVKQQIHILAGFKRRLNSYAEKQDRRP